MFQKVVHDILMTQVPIELNELNTLSVLSSNKFGKAFKKLIIKRLEKLIIEGESKIVDGIGQMTIKRNWPLLFEKAYFYFTN